MATVSKSQGGAAGADFSLDAIHDVDFETVVHDLMARDVARLQERQSEFADGPCPACGATDPKAAFSFQGFSYRRCVACDLLFIAPGPPNHLTLWFLEVSEGLRYWRERMPAEVRQRRKPMYLERAGFLAEQAGRFGHAPATLLEIGAGNGELAEALLQVMPGLERLVLNEPQPLDLDHPKISYCRDDADFRRLAGSVDLVACFEVIEHIPDPAPLLEQVHQALTDEGLFVLSTPNERGFEMQVLGTLSTSLPFDHVCLYNPEALTRLLHRTGFEVLEITTPGKLDLEMVAREHKAGRLDLSGEPALRFLVEAPAEVQTAFQAFLVEHRQSSHMRAVARKRRV